jgi:diguanylate cyclase
VPQAGRRTPAGLPLLTVIRVAGLLCFLQTTTRAIFDGPPGLLRLVAALLLATGAAAFPVRLRIGATQHVYSLGEVALLLDFALLPPAWLVPVMVAGKALAYASPHRPPFYVVTYNTAARCLAVALAVPATHLVTGRLHLFEPTSLAALLVLGLVSAAVNELLAVTAISVAQQMPWRDVFRDGLAVMPRPAFLARRRILRLLLSVNLIMVVVSTLTAMAILVIGAIEPVLLWPLPGVFLALRGLQGSAMRHREDAELSMGLAEATSTLYQTSTTAVANTLAAATVRLLRAARVEVIDEHGTQLAVRTAPGPWQTPPQHRQVRAPLRLADGTELGVLQVTMSGRGKVRDRVTDTLNTLANAAAGALDNARRLEQAHHRASHDPLTGLANRAQFFAALTAAVAEANPNPFAVLMVDLDHFKSVNDEIGHPAGDQLLCEVANRLRAGVRPCDLVGRLGGDEFILLLRDLPAARMAAQRTAIDIAERLVQALAEPVVVDEDKSLDAAGSVGLALYPRDGRSSDELVQHADAALRRAKRDGRRRVRRWDPHRDTDRSSQLEPDLRKAVDNGQLVVLYQPIIDLFASEPVGVEAHLCWQHPTLDLLAPPTVYAIADHSRLTAALTTHALDRALTDRRAWEQAGAPSLPVAVNLPSHALLSKRLLAAVPDLLDHHQTPPDRLILEVPEQVVVANLDAVTSAMHHLRGLGITLAMDDFGAGDESGTGGASLALLARAEVDQVKISHRLISRIEERELGQLIEAAILAVHAFGQTTVAVGIEDGTQLAILRQLGCLTGQGPPPLHPQESPSRTFTAPMPAGKVSEVLKAAVAARPGPGRVIPFSPRPRD